MYTLEELKSIVEKYVRDILQQHDLSVARNSTNKKIFNNIVDKCMDDLKNTELRDQFDNDNCKLRSNGMPVPLLRNGYSIFNGTKYR